MAFGLDDILGLAAPAIGGLVGLFQRPPSDPRQGYLGLLNQQLGQRQNQLKNVDARNLWNMAGAGGDALASVGRRMGSNLAGAGVYDSSATAGALAQGGADLQSHLAALANANLNSELGQQSADQQYLTGLQLGVSGQDYNQKYQQYLQNRYGAIGGLSGALGAFAGQGGGGGGVGAGSGPGGGGSTGYGSAASFMPGEVPMSTRSMPSVLGSKVGGGLGVTGGNLGRVAGNVGNGMQNWTPQTLPDPMTQLNRRMAAPYGAWQ